MLFNILNFIYLCVVSLKKQAERGHRKANRVGNAIITTNVKKLFFVLTGLFVFQTSLAQDLIVPEPEFAYSVIYLQSADKGVPLEAGNPTMESNVKGLGYGGAESIWVMSALKSSVRILEENANALEFVVRMPSHLLEVNPTQVISIVKLDKDTKKSRRTMKMYSYDGLGRQKDGNEVIPITASRYGEKSFRIKPSKVLTPGEYAVLMQQSVGGGTQGFGGWAFFGVEGEEAGTGSSKTKKTKTKRESTETEMQAASGLLLSLGYAGEGGLSLTGGYDHAVTEAITASPSFTYFAGYDGTYFSINGDGKYFYPLSDDVLLYGLAGLAYSSYSFSFENISGKTTVSDSQIGLNLGSGLEYGASERMRLNALVKYNTSWWGQIELQLGLKFLLNR